MLCIISCAKTAGDVEELTVRSGLQQTAEFQGVLAGRADAAWEDDDEQVAPAADVGAEEAASDPAEPSEQVCTWLNLRFLCAPLNGAVLSRLCWCIAAAVQTWAPVSFNQASPLVSSSPRDFPLEVR